MERELRDHHLLRYFAEKLNSVCSGWSSNLYQLFQGTENHKNDHFQRLMCQFIKLVSGLCKSSHGQFLVFVLAHRLRICTCTTELCVQVSRSRLLGERTAMTPFLGTRA